MPRNKILIIGAGVAGLAAGTYLRMNGYDTEIFELHDRSGGVCTSWTRKGYTFDYCIHWLMGSGPSKNLWHIWKDLGAIEGRKFVEWDEYVTVRMKSGEHFTVYTDPDRLFEEMVRLSPEDRAVSKSFCGAIRKLSGFDFPVRRGGFWSYMLGGLKMIPRMPLIIKWSKIMVPAFLAKLKGVKLKEAFGLLFPAVETVDFPMAALIIMLCFMYKKSSGYPIGGSLAFSKAIEKRYLSLGGKVRYNTRIDKIAVKDGRAIGIESNGKKFDGDIVISAADGHATLFEMLGGKYFSPKLEKAYTDLKVYPSLIYVSLGIKKDMKSRPHMQYLSLKNPISLEDGRLVLDWLSLRLYHFDPTMAPPGCTMGVVMISTYNTPWWTGLREADPARYGAEKKRVADQVIAALDAELGDIKSHVEVVDVATPATIVRYTNNWKGSYEGFLPSGSNLMSNGLGYTIPGLDNFYMVGQWIHPGGGLPPDAMDGLAITRKICKEDRRKFRIVP